MKSCNRETHGAGQWGEGDGPQSSVWKAKDPAKTDGCAHRSGTSPLLPAEQSKARVKISALLGLV